MTLCQEKVTVGITCYNASQTIERAIRSAQRQAWDNLEIIIVDDLSSDHSAELVERVIATDPRAKLIRHPKNRGAAEARNTLIAHATGEFLAFFDDDDESHPERVACQVEAIRSFETSNPDSLVACYAGGERQYDNGYIKPLPAIGSKGTPPQGLEVANYLLYYAKSEDREFGSGTPTCALMARRQFTK